MKDVVEDSSATIQFYGLLFSSCYSSGVQEE